MAEPRGKVQRLVCSAPGLPSVQYRTRDLAALFADAEWGWSRDAEEGYVFECYARMDPAASENPSRFACDHVAGLRRAGEAHVHAVVFGSDAEALRRLRREEDRVATCEASIPDFEPSPQPRAASRITERIQDARRRRGQRVDPSEVFERLEKEHLA